VILFAVPRRFCLIAAIASWASCFGQPEILGAVQAKAARHHAIGIAQSLKRRLQIRLSPRFPRPAGVDDKGSMTGGCTHDPVTVATMQGNPGWALLAQALSANTRPRIRPFDHGIELGGLPLRAVPDPSCLRVGTEMHAWIVGLPGRGRHFPPLRPVIPDTDGNPRPEDHHRLRKRQYVVASGTGAKSSRP